MKITLLILCKAKAFRLRVWVKNWISKYNFTAHRLLCSHIKKMCDGLVYKATKLQIESLFGAEQWIWDLNQNIKKKTSLCISSLSCRGQDTSYCVWLCKWDMLYWKHAWSHPEMVSLDVTCGHPQWVARVTQSSFSPWSCGCHETNLTSSVVHISQSVSQTSTQVPQSFSTKKQNEVVLL